MQYTELHFYGSESVIASQLTDVAERLGETNRRELIMYDSWSSISFALDIIQMRGTHFHTIGGRSRRRHILENNGNLSIRPIGYQWESFGQEILSAEYLASSLGSAHSVCGLV